MCTQHKPKHDSYKHIGKAFGKVGKQIIVFQTIVLTYLRLLCDITIMHLAC